MTPSTKPDARSPAKTPLSHEAPAPGPAASVRPAVTERGVSVPIETTRDREADRNILYERLTGEAARRRATAPEPQGAGMTPEDVEKVEYVEVWSTSAPADGYDFRMYTFGGALIASRTTRGH